MFEDVNTPEDLFRKADEGEWRFTAQMFAALRDALMKEGFSRRESLRLVETYSRFVYHLSLEEFQAQKMMELDVSSDDVDDDDTYGVS